MSGNLANPLFAHLQTPPPFLWHGRHKWDNLPSAPEIAHSMAPPPCSAKLQSWLQRDHFAELAPWDACAQIHRRLSKYFYYLGCQTH